MHATPADTSSFQRIDWFYRFIDWFGWVQCIRWNRSVATNEYWYEDACVWTGATSTGSTPPIGTAFLHRDQVKPFPCHWCQACPAHFDVPASVHTHTHTHTRKASLWAQQKCKNYHKDQSSNPFRFWVCHVLHASAHVMWIPMEDVSWAVVLSKSNGKRVPEVMQCLLFVLICRDTRLAWNLNCWPERFASWFLHWQIFAVIVCNMTKFLQLSCTWLCDVTMVPAQSHNWKLFPWPRTSKRWETSREPAWLSENPGVRPGLPNDNLANACGTASWLTQSWSQRSLHSLSMKQRKLVCNGAVQCNELPSSIAGHFEVKHLQDGSRHHDVSGPVSGATAVCRVRHPTSQTWSGFHIGDDVKVFDVRIFDVVRVWTVAFLLMSSIGSHVKIEGSEIVTSTSTFLTSTARMWKRFEDKSKTCSVCNEPQRWPSMHHRTRVAGCRQGRCRKRKRKTATLICNCCCQMRQS